MRAANYVSQSFKDRIEISLADISRSKDDEFQLIGVSFIASSFKCELCKHDPCVYAFRVRNVATGIDKTVGSECVKHFIGELDLDLANGLKKRIKSVTRKMRRYLKKFAEDYKDMPLQDKREATVKLFAKYQAKDLLKNGVRGKSILSREDVLKILDYET